MAQHEQWGSKLSFILAAAGSAIGLGAIWKFPYVAGSSGGGAFFLVFLLFTFLVGFPLLLAEFVIGRSSQKEAISAYRSIAPRWTFIGRMGVFTAFILLSFYSVIGGWILLYFGATLTGYTMGVENYEQLFGTIISNPWTAVGAQLAFMFLTIIVVAKGVKDGIEKASKWMMPALFILFIVLIARSLTLDGAMEGVKYFLQPDFSRLTSEGVLFALGQSFFSLSLGVSVMVTYSSYLSKKESLVKSATSIVMMNIFITILAGLAIFPAVFSFGFEPEQGPGLLFVVLPSVFAQMPGGVIFFAIFLALFLFATLTSAFSMLEIIVASVAKDSGKEARSKASWWIGLAIFVVGIPAALSFGILGDYKWMDKTIFDLMDYLVSNIMLPVGALLISIFVSWRMPRKTLVEELTDGSSFGKKLLALWVLILKFVVPIVIIIVFLDALGVLDMLFG
ncbi:sodium-dependent transporter [Alkalihalobacillus sp. AL-G]|uniref:sodium-dependent transporter n=1 Tax=Alkalihalobacillus sp. AL-G TaxID=2926399 RepID=UPI00272BF464|nr:sodium-dependent transporter [Alkalihalobacillus sp. AL-G]WLD94138.1 sodium-dependent transporter [Alkalihalobacillus sp. AL-G]